MRKTGIFFLTGILLLACCFVQLYVHAHLPYSLAGYSVTSTKEGFEVVDISRFGPAGIAGLKKGDIIVRLNDIDTVSFIEQYSYSVCGSNRTAFTQYSKIYERGASYRCERNDGVVKTFVIPGKATFFNALLSMDTDSSVCFLTGILFIIIGVVISCLAASINGIPDFIMFLYSAGICIINSYSMRSNPLAYTVVNILLYDLSAAAVAFFLIRIIRYFCIICSRKRTAAALRYIAYVSPALMCLKYVLIVSGVHDFYDTPLEMLSSFLLAASLLYAVVMFFFLLMKMPHQSSVFLRFFILGTVFGAFPTLATSFARILSGSSSVIDMNETLYTILPLLFIPFSLFCAIFQTLNVKFDSVASRFMSAGATIIALLVIIVFLPYDRAVVNRVMLVSPLLYLLFSNPIEAFLYPKIDAVQRSLDSLERTSFRCSDTNLIYEITADWLFSVLNPRFVAFYMLDAGTEDIQKGHVAFVKYKKGGQCSELLEEMLAERLSGKNVDRLLIQREKGFSYPLHQAHVLSGYIFLGSRSPHELFSNSEMRLLSPVSRILMESMMMRDLKKQADYVSEMQNQIVYSFADMIESRDGTTGQHIKRTSTIVGLLAQYLKEHNMYADKLMQSDYDMIALAAPLHDIGKIKIPDSILSKPGKLTDEEFNTIKMHPEEGERIIRRTMSKIEDDRYLRLAREMALYHHEKWNGKGYPMGLSGEAIPVSARIMAIADVFDALCSSRSYKEAFSISKAFSILEESRDSHFESCLVDVMEELRPELEKIYPGV